MAAKSYESALGGGKKNRKIAFGLIGEQDQATNEPDSKDEPTESAPPPPPDVPASVVELAPVAVPAPVEEISSPVLVAELAPLPSPTPPEPVSLLREALPELEPDLLKKEQKGKKQEAADNAEAESTSHLTDYSHFLHKRETGVRAPTYVSEDVMDALREVAHKLGDRGFTVTALLNNIVLHHFQQYGPELAKRIREKDAQTKKKRLF